MKFIISFDDSHYYDSSKSAIIHLDTGKANYLTPHSKAIFEHLAENKDCPKSVNDIKEVISWIYHERGNDNGYNRFSGSEYEYFVGDRAVRVAIHELRKQMGPYGELIKNKYGIGYVYTGPAPEKEDNEYTDLLLSSLTDKIALLIETSNPKNLRSKGKDILQIIDQYIGFSYSYYQEMRNYEERLTSAIYHNNLELIWESNSSLKVKELKTRFLILLANKVENEYSIKIFSSAIESLENRLKEFKSSPLIKEKIEKEIGDFKQQIKEETELKEQLMMEINEIIIDLKQTL